MIDDQIQDGDIIIVEQRQTAENGEPVVAMINGERVTLKRCFVEPDTRCRARRTASPLPASAASGRWRRSEIALEACLQTRPGSSWPSQLVDGVGPGIRAGNPAAPGRATTGLSA
jgi:hypothetical protein